MNNNRNNNFMADLRNIASEGLQKYTEYINRELAIQLPDISTDLCAVIRKLLDCYEQMESAGEVKQLQWIYISYLRTSLLDGLPCYRIDLYDERDCISETECAASWDFVLIYDCFYKVKQQIIDRTCRQTQVNSYEADKIINSLGEHFRRLSDMWIPKLIEQGLQDALPLPSGVKIMLGEFLDQAEQIAEIS